MHEVQQFQPRQQKTSHQPLLWIKQEVNLIDFATTNLGWQINQQKSSQRDVVLKHPQHGVIIAPSSPRNRHWVFSWADRKGGGTLVDLLRLNGWDWPSIKTLSGEVTQPVAALPDAPPEATPQAQTELAQAKFDAFKQQPGPSYLERRGIDPFIEEGFSSCKTNGSQAIFKLYSFSEEGHQHLCSTISYCYDREGNSQKYFQKGLPRGLAVLSDPGRIERLVVTESPIDALSFRQVEALESKTSAPRTMYVSTCGNLSRGVVKSLGHLFKQAEQQYVLVAGDNDRAGQAMGEKVAEMASDHGLSSRVCMPPTGKDWNAYLMHYREELRTGVRKTGYSRDTDPPSVHPTSLHKTPAYKQTLLEWLSLSQKACQSLQGYEAREKEIAFPWYTSLQAVKTQKPTEAYAIKLEEKGLSRTRLPQNPGLVVLPAAQAKLVVITSDPLDIFLHRAEAQSKCAWPWQKPPATTYISTCGQEAKSIQAPLQALVGAHSGRDICLYMRAQEAEVLQKQLQERGEAAHYAVQPPPKAIWHAGLQQAAHDLRSVLRQDQEEWEPMKPKRRKGKGRRR